MFKLHSEFSPTGDQPEAIKQLVEGIKNNEFKIFMQPKFDIKTEKIVGAEALIRRQKDNKLIMPNSFIPEYEKTNLITKLDMFVFESIVKKIKNTFNLTPRGIIKSLDLRRPIYKQTTNYGHFGKENLPWEKIIKLV